MSTPARGAPRRPPRTSGAPRTSRVRRTLAYARFETVGFLRNGEQLLVSVVLPALVLLGLGVADAVTLPRSAHARLDVVAPGVLALAVVSSSFTSIAIATAFDRRWGVLRQLATTPLGVGGIVRAKALAVVALQVVQLALLGGLALALGWRPDAALGPVALLGWLLGSVCFTSIGLVLAGRLRAEAVLAVANLAWVVMAAVGGLVLPADPSTFQVPGAAWLPSGALGDAVRAPLLGEGVPVVSLAVLAGWAVLALAGAARWFRPTE